MSVIFSTDSLKSWFLEQKRDLPWRKEITPYRVWVSEIMLQQTQVATVIEYYNRWMEAFPTIAALAAAPLPRVIKKWEGLGYYSRARHLHTAAKVCVELYGGELPNDPKALGALKGIGPYTKAAILNFAFKKRAAVVDGNVMRVISRLFALEDPIDLPLSRKKVEEIVENLLPKEEFWIISEALMELGALICKPIAQCTLCPLQKECRAFHLQKTLELPFKSKKTPIIQLERLVAVVIAGDRVLLKQEGSKRVMRDLYEFPFIETESQKSQEQAINLFESHFGISLRLERALKVQEHSFTRYRARLSPFLFYAQVPFSGAYIWYPIEKLRELPFSSGHKRIMEAIF